MLLRMAPRQTTLTFWLLLLALIPRPLDAEKDDRNTTDSEVSEAEPEEDETEVIVSEINLTGEKLDPREKLLKIIRLEKGTRMEPGRLLKHLDMIKDHLDRLGYFVTILENWSGNLVKLDIAIEPVPIIRHVHIRGNWPLFETHIERHLRYRSGTRLPPEAERDEAFKRQRRRILDYLAREGYFEGDLEIVVEETNKPHVVNLLVLLRPLWTISPLWFWNPYSYRLGRLTVEGNQALDTDKIKKIFTHDFLWWSKPFTANRFNKDIERLKKKYHELGYPEVRIRHDFSPAKSLDRKRKRVDINITIRENRKLELVFEGNRRIGDRDLKNQVTFFNEGNSDDFEMENSRKAIQRYYQTRGFFQTRVYAAREQLSPRADRITFTVDERGRLEVKGISFEGNRHFSDRRLRRVIETKEFPLLGAIGLGSGGFVTTKQLMEDAERIQEFYRSRGFRYARCWGAAATRPEAFRRPASVALLESLGPIKGRRDEIYVRFYIREGKQVNVERVNIECKNEEIRKLLQKTVRMRVGRPFTEKSLEEELSRIKETAANRGYPYVQVEYEAKPSPERTGVFVTFKVDPGPLVHFGEVFIRGNLKTSTRVIRREITIKSGEVFSLKKRTESQRNLGSLGVLQAAQITFLGLQSQKNPVHVLVEVRERFDDYGSVEVGAGVSTDNPWFVNLSYTNRNLFGWGKQFRIEGEYGDIIQRGRVTYKDPRFLRTNLILDLTGFVRNEDTVRLGQLLTYGGSASIIKRFTEKIQLFMRYEIKRVRMREPLRRTAAGMDESREVDVFTTTATIGPTFIWDRRDNPLIPTKGFQIVTSLRWASRYLLADLVDTADFLHLRFAGQLFIPLPLDIVVAQGLRYDHGFPIGATVMLPKTERFYGGGDTTVRGYERDQLYTTVEWSPLSPYGEGSLYNVTPRGGNLRLVYNAEIHFPIWKESILFGLPLRGAIFFDTASIANTLYSKRGFKDFFSNFKHSMGVALRIVTPVGALSVAYAVPFEPSYGTDPSGRVHFNFGFIF